jgi:hypothetical protein
MTATNPPTIKTKNGTQKRYCYQPVYAMGTRWPPARRRPLPVVGSESANHFLPSRSHRPNLRKGRLCRPVTLRINPFSIPINGQPSHPALATFVSLWRVIFNRWCSKSPSQRSGVAYSPFSTVYHNLRASHFHILLTTVRHYAFYDNDNQPTRNSGRAEFRGCSPLFPSCIGRIANRHSCCNSY